MGRCSKTAVYVRGHCDKKVALYREKHRIKEIELREGGKRREVTKVRREIVYSLSARERNCKQKTWDNAKHRPATCQVFRYVRGFLDKPSIAVGSL